MAGFANQGYLPSTPLEVLPKRSNDANEALFLKTGSHQYAKLLDELDEHLSALSGCIIIPFGIFSWCCHQPCKILPDACFYGQKCLAESQS